MADPAGAREEEDARLRMGRRGFVGAGLAAAGAALIRHPGAATAQSPAAGNGDRQADTPQAGMSQLPLRQAYPNLPAVPVDEAGTADTLERLQIREQQELQPKQGLIQKFTIGGKTRRAYTFLFGDSPVAAPQSVDPLSLEHPEQFSISWTNFPDVYDAGQPFLPEWSASLTDADSATRQFWPMIAEHGFGFNLIIPERVDRARGRELRSEFGAGWTRQVRSALAAGNLYVIDLSRFEILQSQTVNGAPRFTPATIILLTRNPRTRSLTPVAILVSGNGGSGRTLYTRSRASDSAWLYALQAAKAAVTLYGVWLGHVYHWHIVTAAMQMTMFNTFSADHPIYQLLAPQSKFAIPFDNVLLELWPTVAPPTSLATAEDFLGLANNFAEGRTFFDDDPTTTIQQLGLRRKDFTRRTGWDRYPVVKRLLQIWDLVTPYVDTFVSTTYASDDAVAADQELQSWIATSASTDPSSGGNIRGLPEMNTRDELQRVLTSLLYRITVHGISNLVSTAHPALTFLANYPHCLQRTDIPGPRARISARELLTYLPNTNSISQAVNFYFTFTFSTNYEPFIPLGGVGKELFFPGGGGDPRNEALIELRRGLDRFIADFQPDMPQPFAWPRNIEL